MAARHAPSFSSGRWDGSVTHRPMKRSTALARLSDVATQSAGPLVGRLLDTVRGKADELSRRLLGEDFEERVEWLRARYQARGGDPFGLDPDVAKSAVAV